MVKWLMKLLDVDLEPIQPQIRQLPSEIGGAVPLWQVRWLSRYNEYHSGTKPEVRGFSSRQAADDFAESLRTAFKLLRHTSGTKVEIEELN